MTGDNEKISVSMPKNVPKATFFRWERVEDEDGNVEYLQIDVDTEKVCNREEVKTINDYTTGEYKIRLQRKNDIRRDLDNIDYRISEIESEISMLESEKFDLESEQDELETEMEQLDEDG